MPNLKNSLVNLIIILFSLFFLSVSSADNDNFIFPKKKIIVIKKVEKKQIEIKKNENQKVNLPQKKPVVKKVSKPKQLVNSKKNVNLIEGKNQKKINFLVFCQLKNQ